MWCSSEDPIMRQNLCAQGETFHGCLYRLLCGTVMCIYYQRAVMYIMFLQSKQIYELSHSDRAVHGAHVASCPIWFFFVEETTLSVSTKLEVKA